MGFKFKELFWISPAAEPPASAEPEVEVTIEDVACASARGAAGSVERILANLGDVDGVIGGIALGPDGTVLGQSPDAPFDAETVERLSARASQLLAALCSDSSGANAPKGGVLRFRNRQLYLNPIASGVVGVLAENRVNVPALTMALRVVARQLDARVASPEVGR